MEAMLYEKAQDAKVICHLCNHQCTIHSGRRGICGVRENEGGVLKTLIYGKLVAGNADPVEKKPLFHFMPGSRTYSIAAVGCNFKCRFCQNSDIAQMPSDRDGLIMGNPTSPREVVNAAIQRKCRSISFTYTEPTLLFEFALHTSEIARNEGLKTIFVTNGYMTKKAIETLSPFLDAANVDLKGSSDDFYRKYCSARIEPVKETLRSMKALGIFIEITTLVIPGLNDTAADFESISRFIAEDLGRETPWHVSRFHPAYQLTDHRATDPRSLSLARDIGIRNGLCHVYTGNIPGDEGEHTYCHQCGKKIIDRFGYTMREFHITNGACAFCKAEIHGVDMRHETHR